jgi:hypothetical protein
MNIEGKIKVVGETVAYGSSGFRKRELVITTSDQYPQTIMVEFVQDKVDLLNSFAIGQEVNIAINLRGREWINPEGVAKYFNSINGWKIDALEISEGVTASASVQSQVDDDLPF